MKGELKPCQAKFVDEYLIDLNPARAYRAAYPRTTKDSTAWTNSAKLLKNAQVSRAIQERQAERAEEVKITQNDVLRDLIVVKDRCLQRSPVCNMKGEQVVDGSGNHLWTFNARDGVKALEVIGKHLGMFVEKHEHSLGADLVDAIMEARNRGAEPEK